jgi:AraC-like DNA-binding protein
VAGDAHKLEVLGPGHAFEVIAGERFLYLPLAAKGPLVEWVLSIEPEASALDVPEVRRVVPVSDPIAVPLTPPKHDGLHPDWAVPWLGLPADVATWASALQIRGTSLTQRLSRLVNESPKRILMAARATIAFELAAHYRGEGAALAIDTGYASQSHLSRDLRDRFGIPATKLFAEGPVRELEWLRLVKSVAR